MRYITVKNFLLDDEVVNGMGYNAGTIFRTAPNAGEMFLIPTEPKNPTILLDMKHWQQLLYRGYVTEIL